MTLDWQTAVVTIVALGAALVIVRRFAPARRRSNAGPGAPSASGRVRPLRDRREGHARRNGRNGRQWIGHADPDDARRQRRRLAPIGKAQLSVAPRRC